MRHVLPHFAMRLAIICSQSRAPDVLYSYTFNYASTIVTKLNASGKCVQNMNRLSFPYAPTPATAALAAAPSDASNLPQSNRGQGWSGVGASLAAILGSLIEPLKPRIPSGAHDTPVALGISSAGYFRPTHSGPC